MYCVKCGKEIKGNNKFCVYCGAPVEQEDPAEEQQVSVQFDEKTVQLDEAGNSYDARYDEGYEAVSYGGAEPEYEPPKKSGLKVLLVILIIALVILIAAGIVAGLFIFKGLGKDGEGKKDIQEEVITEEDPEDTDISSGDENGEKSDSEDSFKQDEEDGAKDKEDKEDNEEEKDDDDDEDAIEEDKEYQEDTGIHEYEYIIEDITWKQAYRECIKRGGYLLHINSTEEYEKILEDLDNEKYQNINFYIGGRRDVDAEEYYWINADGDYFGEVLNSPSLMQYWFDGEPSFENEDEDELFMDIFYRKSDDKWYWNDIPNDVVALSDYFEGRVGYICEYE